MPLFPLFHLCPVFFTCWMPFKIDRLFLTVKDGTEFHLNSCFSSLM